MAAPRVYASCRVRREEGGGLERVNRGVKTPKKVKCNIVDDIEWNSYAILLYSEVSVVGDTSNCEKKKKKEY